MLVKVLGTAAGGGFPQWNCNCKCCGTARNNSEKAPPRLHACIAISSSGKNWFLVNATPDIRIQIESFQALHAGPGLRNSPVKGILLTDAEFDHTIGLLIVREGTKLQIFGSQPVLNCLNNQFPVKSMLESYASFDWQVVASKKEFLIDDNNLKVTPFHLDNKPPKYAVSRSDGKASDTTSSTDWVIGYRFEELASGRSFLFAPQVSNLDSQLFKEALSADLLFVDGTCSCNNEITRLGITDRTSLDMGHLPLFDENGIVSGISRINQSRAELNRSSIDTYLLHINNTNPILILNSPEAEKLNDFGIKLASDGQMLEL